MSTSVNLRFQLSGLVAAGFAILVAAPAVATGANAQSVRADYDVSFAGIKLGKFSFTSTVNGSKYTLRSYSKMKMAFGALKWKSATSSSGTFGQSGPRPARYDFTYKMNKKSGFTKMTFTNGAVGNVERKPNKKSKSRVVVKPEHLRNVLDPMSAILSLTLAKLNANAGKPGGHPCARRVPVFDGKQRFDLVLTPKRQERIRGRGAGAPTMAFVCKVKYVPVSGHKMNRQTKFMVSNSGIETWMMPLPDAGIYAPYRIVLPILVGSAVINTRRLNVRVPGKAPISLKF